MTTKIDEILEKGLGHSGCAIEAWEAEACMHGASVAGLKPDCNCGSDKSRKYLERLKKPTKAMKLELMDWLLETDYIRMNEDGYGITIETAIITEFVKRLLKAAEEGL